MKRVLIVDDNPLDLKLVSSLIHNSFSVETNLASNGTEALKLLSQKEFDLVITDIIMPQIEGIELINKIRNKNHSLNIIAISSGRPFYLYLAKKLGIQAVFTKPLDKESFLNKLKFILLPTETAENIH